MPLRPMDREQAWLLPPSLDDLLPDDHPARFVAAFIDGPDRSTWTERGIDLEGDVMGAPAYHPRALLSVWLYGFMSGVRSCRKLESACRDQIPYLWLTGWQYPDHNTLWRFYKAHRQAMRRLLKHTISIAVEVGLLDLAVQAVDGTKVAANAAGDQTYDAAGLQRLLERTEAVISELEAQNEGDDTPVPPRLPKELKRAQELRQRVHATMDKLTQSSGKVRVNLTDEDLSVKRYILKLMPTISQRHSTISSVSSLGGN
jgi:transposase